MSLQSNQEFTKVMQQSHCDKPYFVSYSNKSNLHVPFANNSACCDNILHSLGLGLTLNVNRKYNNMNWYKEKWTYLKYSITKYLVDNFEYQECIVHVLVLKHFLDLYELYKTRSSVLSYAIQCL